MEVAARIVDVLAVLSSTAFGIAALWAATGHGGRLARGVPVTLMLAAMLPIGAYELLALFAAQSATVVGTIGAWRLAVSRRFSTKADQDQRSSQQFGLRKLLVTIAILGLILTCVHYRAPSMETLIRESLQPWRWITIGGAVGVTTASSYYLVSGLASWRGKLAAGFMAVAAAIVVDTQLEVLDIFTSTIAGTSPIVGEGFAITVLQSAAIAASIIGLRVAGWAWWASKTRNSHAEAAVASRSVSQRFIQPLARFILVASSAVATLSLAWLYWMLLPPRIPPMAALPNPNGHVELIQAAEDIDWNAYPSDSDSAEAEHFRKFVQSNQPALAQLRTALSTPARVPIDYFVWSAANVSEHSTVRSMCYALLAESKLAESEQRFADAAQADLDTMRVAQTYSRGGLALHELVASAIEEFGVRELARHLHQLDPATLRAICRKLEAIEREREPIANIARRDRRFEQTSWGWIGRLRVSIVDMMKVLNPSEAIAFPHGDFGNRRAVQIRLLIAEAAVRAYIEERGAPPASLADLAPEYFARTPLDPYGNGPLVYRVQNGSYLLYSVGRNRVDDGGKRATYVEAFVDNKGDIFFDPADESTER